MDAYGYGWRLGQIVGHAVRCHGGDNAGFRSFNAWFPEHSAHVIVLCNNDNVDPYALTVRLVQSQIATT